MVISCREVWREISNHIEGALHPEIRRAMDEHVAQCPQCRAVLDGARNVVALAGDERVFPMPEGFSRRLEARIGRVTSPALPRRWSLVPSLGGWYAASAAAGLVMGLFTSEYLRPMRVPAPETAEIRAGARSLEPVAIAAAGSKFHHPKCSHLGKHHVLVSSGDAARRGYQPCPRCIKDGHA